MRCSTRLEQFFLFHALLVQFQFKHIGIIQRQSFHHVNDVLEFIIPRKASAWHIQFSRLACGKRLTNVIKQPYSLFHEGLGLEVDLKP